MSILPNPVVELIALNAVMIAVSLPFDARAAMFPLQWTLSIACCVLSTSSSGMNLCLRIWTCLHRTRWAGTCSASWGWATQVKSCCQFPGCCQMTGCLTVDQRSALSQDYRDQPSVTQGLRA